MPDDEAEPNDTLGAANGITSGSPVTGQVATPDDLDLFAIAVDGAGSLQVNFDVPTNSSFTEYFALGLYDAAGSSLALFETGEDRIYELGVQAAGTYYLGVSATQYSHDSNLYSLTTTYTAGAADSFEAEPNDTLGAANGITSGSPVTGQVATPDDLDLFAIAVDGAGSLQVNFDVPTNSSFTEYFALGLYDAAGSSLALFETGEDRIYELGVQAAGTYYLGVSATQYSHDSNLYSLTTTYTAGAADSFEAEPNDTLGAANGITSGSPVTGQVATPDDLDLFAIAVDGAGSLQVNFDVPTNSSFTEYFALGLYDAAGSSLALFETGEDRIYELGVQAAGTYYLGVSATQYSHDSNLYSLTTTYTAGAADSFEAEPNDEYANPLFDGFLKRGQLADQSDIDWFYIDVELPSDLSIDFDAPTSSEFSEYFTLWVVDENGNLIGGRQTGQDLTFSVGAPEPGPYFVGIEAGTSFDTGQYGLTVTRGPINIVRESETNDTLETADELELSVSINGQLSNPDDQDHYAVTLTSAGTLSVSFDGPTQSTWANYFQISVLDGSGEMISLIETGSDVAFDTKVDLPGTYYYRITSTDFYHDDGTYRLGVTAALDDPVPDGAIVGTPLDDFIEGTSEDDLIYGLGGNDQIAGGSGSDTVAFRTASANLDITTIRGLTSVKGRYSAGEHANTTNRLWNVEELRTQSGTINLSTGDFTPILGTQSDDTLQGSLGDDVFDGLGGSDFVDGNRGQDTLVLFGAEKNFEVVSISGITEISAKETANDYAGETIKTVDVETLAFSQNQYRPLETFDREYIIGSTSSERIMGTQSDDFIDGQGGSDEIDGSFGHDTLIVFGEISDFELEFPSQQESWMVLAGKPGGRFENNTIRSKNVETIEFIDLTLSVENPPTIIAGTSNGYLEEGGTGSEIEVALSVEPNSPVKISVVADEQLQSSHTELLFDKANWSEVQTIEITAVDDSSFEQQHLGTVQLGVQTSDPIYKDIEAPNFEFIIGDNDTSNLGGISGSLWNDSDKDGSIDNGEIPLSGWTVFDDFNGNGRLDAGEKSSITDSSGQYRLLDLESGDHTIIAQARTGWLPTYPSASAASATIITASSNVEFIEGPDPTQHQAASNDIDPNSVNLGLATRIDEFRSDPRFHDILGQGYSVAVLDTGADLDHPYFGPDVNSDGISDRIIFQYDFSGTNDGNASDTHGHGTHVAGTAASSDEFRPGIAPEAGIVVLKVFPDGDNPRVSSADMGEALRWVTQNAAAYNIVAVNLSLGGGQYDTKPHNGYAHSLFKSLANIGVTVVAASGNGYYENSRQGVSYPSSDPYALSIGAVWPHSGEFIGVQVGVTDAIAVFSQRDDELTDVFAPGVSIDSAWLDGESRAISGTSMASPEVAGVVILAQQLAQRELGRRLSYEEIRSLLNSTGETIVDGDDENDTVPNTGLEFKRLDVMALAEAILGLKPPASHSVEVSAGEITSGLDFGFTATTAIQALSGDDLVFGTSFGEVLRGGSGNDEINGGAGDDEVFGEAGNDVLIGAAGDDILIGGLGADIFVVRPGDDKIRISDFELGVDTLDLTAFDRQEVLAALAVAEPGSAVITFGDGTLLTVDGEGVSPQTLSLDNFKLAAGNQPPTGSVIIEGNVAQGQTLTANTDGVEDPDGIDPATEAGQWLRDGTPIPGATGETYVLTQDDVGAQISVVYSYMDNFGTSESVTSSPTAVVSAVGLSVVGTPFPDPLEGGPGADTIQALASDDTITGSAGNDQIDGGEGADTAVYSGDQTSYTLTLSPTGTMVTDRRADGNGTDTLIDMEFLDFDTDILGGPFNLGIFGGPASLSDVQLESFIELYIAYFNRAPDAIGLNFWGTAFANGLTLEEMAAEFGPQDETQAAYPPGTSNEVFATTVYNNVLGRTPDQAGIDFWVGQLDMGHVSRDQFILNVLQGAKSDLKPELGPDFVAQQLADQAYLDNKIDIGAYYAVHKGMSDVDNASATMAIFDGTEDSITDAVAAIDGHHADALDPTNGEFLMPLVGVLDDPFAMV